jgi:lariat debranching enzyme
MPPKYYAMHDFHEYYAGSRVAPYLTIFIGGNHEASNYMWELYYGGWAAPRIYYMGAANVVRVGPLRIAGLSGIWKGYNYKKPHHERLPYNSDDVRSIYHVRELDVRKLLQIRSQVDIGLSHDWPRGMEWKGNYSQLFKWKPDFEQEAKDGTLGSVAATAVLERLRPAHWFSAHMHVKFAGMWEHSERQDSTSNSTQNISGAEPAHNADEIELDVAEDEPAAAPKNDAEIDLDMDDEDLAPAPTDISTQTEGSQNTNGTSEVPQDLRDLLPASFSRSKFEPKATLPFPAEITNKTTKFLALDKCLPKRSFLQLLEVTPHAAVDLQRPLRLEYDLEWLAITRVFAKDLQVGDIDVQVPTDEGDAHYRPMIEAEMNWVKEHIAKAGKTVIPEDFAQTAPIYEPGSSIQVEESPQEYSNQHTQAFCELLQIPNVFHASDQERAQMIQAGPRPEEQRSNRGRGGGRGGRGGFRGGDRGRGGGRGRGHGGGRGRGGRGRGTW